MKDQIIESCESENDEFISLSCHAFKGHKKKDLMG